MAPAFGLAIAATPGWLSAAWPLLEAGRVEALQVTVDELGAGVPEWLAGLLRAFGEAGRLSGHSVRFAPLAVARAEGWHEALERLPARPRCMSDHFGTGPAAGWRFGPPLPLPASRSVVELGVERLRELQALTGGPVGLENLALAWSREDCLEQGPLLEALLAPVDGYLLLDVHNLWCQLVNFDLDADELLDRYPLARVREVHVAGGHWANTPAGRFRRDTHDHAVPDEVWMLLERVLARCPHVEAVFLERIRTAFAGPEDEASYRADAERLAETLARPVELGEASPCPPIDVADDPGREALAAMQAALYDALAESVEPREALAARPELQPWRHWVERADDRALATSAALVRSWGRRD